MNEIHHRVDQLDLNLLKVFEAVYREQHLGRAAAHLFLTPSAVSHALRRLREFLGDPLFVKDGRKMQPTPVCARMAPELLDELSKLRALLQRWGKFDPKNSQQHFRLSIPEPVEIMWLPNLLQKLHENAPNTSLTTTRTDRRELTTALSNNTLDLAIDVSYVVKKPLRSKPLFSDEICLVTRVGHSLGKTITKEKYAKASHISVSSRATGMVIEDAALANLGLTRTINVRCQNYHSAIAIVEKSDFVLTMPLKLATVTAQGKQVIISKLPFNLQSVDLSLYWHSDVQDDPANTWFRDLIINRVLMPD